MIRRLASFLIVCLLIGYIPVPPGSAAEDRLVIIKKSLNIPENAEVRELSGDLQISWEGHSAHAMLNRETGELINYQEYSFNKLPTPVSQSYCLNEVREIIRQLWPDKAQELKLLYTSRRYDDERGLIFSFRFGRFEGIIPVEPDGVDVEFDASSGRIKDLRIMWFTGSLPATANLISHKNAAKIYSQAVPLKLEWMKIPSGQGDLKFNLRPVYKAVSDYTVDAENGELISPKWAYEPLPYNFNSNEKPKIYPSFSVEPNINEAEAASIARNKLNIKDSYIIDYQRRHWRWGEQGKILGFTFKDPGSRETTNVSVDTVTGLINGILNEDAEYGPRNKDFNYETGMSRAKELCKSMAAQEFSGTKLSKLS